MRAPGPSPLPALARWRNTAFAAAVVALALTGWSMAAWATGTALLALSGAGHLAFHRDRTRRTRDAAPRLVTAPVRGRWRALNGPAGKVPSHGTHACAQTYAIDVVHEPEDGGERPGFAWWPLARRPEAFPAYGTAVLAPADGTVAVVHDGARDHLSRTSWPALLLLFAEGLVRSVAGVNRLLGNHVVLDLGDGTYALAAHLRRGSLAVVPGQAVRAGELLARCGNSGNSSEPHVHFQLMTGPRCRHAHGLPFRWRHRAGGEDRTGVPGNDTLFTPLADG
ncbi:M23 family metallopeptidase [Streptomyces sp. TRM 70351]|uniref:M23 family metallopeptidase n=1 Tax=Streptomyces sp. TRM 70351 TaxID=3116552 RepID=UPI002E7BD521|nr:M23 family metallopeptidase [Streptomyces sp. TRM 70351]MEE1930071.1 M23 family metallopeptidase [Streptomyces sp. TRM 70351]